MSSDLDCVVVGVNAAPFSEILAEAVKHKQRSGAFAHFAANAALFDGQRLAYPELFDRCFESSIGETSSFNIFRVPQLGVHYLANALLNSGLSVDVVNFFNIEQEKFSRLLDARPRSVIITTTFYTDPAPIRAIVAFIRERAPRTTIVVGGTYIFGVRRERAPYVQEFIYDSIGADIYIVDSQGETALVKLCLELRSSSPDLSGIDNLVIRNADRSFSRTPVRSENNDLNQHSIDWERLAGMGLMNSKMAIVRTARSCAYACSFCRYPVLEGRHVWSGVESVERELDSLKSTGATTLLFVDDTFNIPADRFKELCRLMIRKRYGFRWMSYLRCGDADAEAIDLAAESGCLGVFIGIESGDQGILQNMNKKTTLKQYRTGIRRLRERGVLTHASVIFGFPGETEKTARATMRFLQDSGIDSFNSEAYYHDKKSPIGLKQDFFGLKGSGYSWSHDSMDWKGAAELVAESYRNLDGPVVIPLFRFSIWSIGYYMSEGIPQASMMDFLRRGHPFVIKSTDESYQVPTGSREALLSVFRDLDLGSGRLCE